MEGATYDAGVDMLDIGAVTVAFQARSIVVDEEIEEMFRMRRVYLASTCVTVQDASVMR